MSLIAKSTDLVNIVARDISFDLLPRIKSRFQRFRGSDEQLNQLLLPGFENYPDECKYRF